jgi:hypothetical protein
MAAKDLSSTSAYPTLGIDTSMPQHRLSAPEDPKCFPGQHEYPVWYFFHGTLADPEVLGRLLGIVPSYRNAYVQEGMLKTWGGKYKALVDNPGGVAYGSAFLVQDQEQEDILRCYETENYEVVRCNLIIENEKVSALTFRFIELH